MGGKESFHCDTGDYHLTVDFSQGRLILHASSELAGKRFKSEFTDDTLPTNLKHTYKKCESLYSLMNEAAAAKKVGLSNAGELKFTFTLKSGVVQVEQEIMIMLKEEISKDEVDISNTIRNALAQEVKDPTNNAGKGSLGNAGVESNTIRNALAREINGPTNNAGKESHDNAGGESNTIRNALAQEINGPTNNAGKKSHDNGVESNLDK